MKKWTLILAAALLISGCAYAENVTLEDATVVIERETQNMMNTPLLMLREKEKMIEQDKQNAQTPIIDKTTVKEIVVEPVVEESTKKIQTVEDYIKLQNGKDQATITTFEEIRNNNIESAKKEMEAAKKAAVEARKGKQ